MEDSWKEDLLRENYTDKWLILLIEKILAQQKKETIDEVKKDLLDLTKGIDNDGSVYIARQLDYLDIEDLFKRYDTK